MIWYELWDMSMGMMLDEGDDPASLLEIFTELDPPLEPELITSLELIERHPALNAESTLRGVAIQPHLEKRVVAQAKRSAG